MKGKISVKISLVVLVFLVSLLLIAFGCQQRIDQQGKWRALSEIKPEVQDSLIKKAIEFGEIIEIINVTYPRVTSSHTHFVNVLGVDKDSVQIVVGVDPETSEVVKMVKLCPRKISEAKEVKISGDQAKTRCLDFLKSKSLSIPENYLLEEAEVVSLGLWKRWRFVWRHIEKEVRVIPDFIMMEINASEEANIISYSKVHHKVLVDLTPKLNSSEAANRTKEFMKELSDLKLVDSSLAVVYPNNFFQKQVWEWSEKQALCWILKFYRNEQHVTEIWIDAITGVIHGGIMCHTHAPEVFGIDSPTNIPTHMQSHLNNIWSPYLDMMKFDVSSFEWTNANAGFTEATISNAISNGRYFIVEGHGDVTATAEQMTIAYQGTADAQAFTPDEVPANNLRFVLLDVCQSGEDGTGSDFKDTFISQGGDVFIGFDDYMCAWNYEESLLHYLAQGMHLANAHNLADADVSPWYTIVITYNVGCLNMVRLAPLLVTVTRSPSANIGTGATFTVTASINNREDVDHTAATNVHASLVLPAGFTITSGANPQNVGTVNWNSPKTATWTVTAPGGSGLYTLDVEVWSDNLGVEVDNPDDPYHKFDVNVVAGFGCSR
ncbi:hypothetical protein KAR91_15305 [Candidatus Pacearchaeota archaeon]|nr:hypothetical protein [Candidatus Pacearchaeota archaeon]